MASSNPSETSRDNLRLHQRAAFLRYQGYFGIRILLHRAFRTLPLKPWKLVNSAVMALTLTLLWLTAGPYVGRLWAQAFEKSLALLGIRAVVTTLESTGVYFTTVLPRVTVSARTPTTRILVVAGVLTAAAMVVSFQLPPSRMPAKYLLRAFSFIQATAIVYFTFFAASFPHDLSGYLSTMLASSLAFVSAIPAIMSFTFYIFDISLARKLLLTVITMAHLIGLIPLQYLVHCYIIAKWSALYMPVLYIMFGLLPQIGIFIAFYSWGMSWPGEDGRS